MKTIVVCDDDEKELKATLATLDSYFVNHGITIKAQGYLKVEHLLSSLDTLLPDLVFMDIEFDGKPEGIEAVRIINQQAPNCQVVYLTNYLQYAVDVYRTDHVWFVLKGQLEQRLPELFEKLEVIEQSRRAHIVVTTKEGSVANIPCSDIRYLERRNRATYIHTENKVYIVREKLPVILEKMPDTLFARCHNSFAVNMASVAEINTADVLLDDGTRVLMSRSYTKSFREAFLNWADYWIV